MKLVGRTYDLTAAYKQFGVSSFDRVLLRIAVKDTDANTVRLLGVNSLPFGASGSVGGFLRLSLAVWYIGLVGLRLAWTAYFDDYTNFSAENTASNAEGAITGLFNLLGLDFAQSGDKALKYSQRFKALGVCFDLSEASEGRASIGHTAERRSEIELVLTDILDKGSVSSKLAESLRGRLHWFETFAFGRIANQAIQTLGELALRSTHGNKLQPHEVTALRFLRDRVPLLLQPSSMETWIIYTDGAGEGPAEKIGSIGGVLFSPAGSCVNNFGSLVPKDIMSVFCEDSLNPIYELEILPLLIALILWGPHMRTSSVVFYIDNDAARSGFIRANGATTIGAKFVAEFVTLETHYQCKAWFGRVPSSSNIADQPSRLCFDLVRKLNAEAEEIPWHRIAAMLA